MTLREHDGGGTGPLPAAAVFPERRGLALSRAALALDIIRLL